MHRRKICSVPDEVPIEWAASATDADDFYSALFRIGQAKPDMNIALIGIGGLGQFALRAAKAKGFENVYAVDVSEQARELAHEIGAKEVVSDIKELKDKEIDLIVDYAGFKRHDFRRVGSGQTVRNGRISRHGQIANDHQHVHVHHRR